MLWDGRNWGDSRSQAWHFTVERQVMSDTVLRLSYSGNHSSNLEQRFSINSREAEYNYVARTGLSPSGNRDQLLRPNPDWNLYALNRTGFSNTHSGQVEVERRFSKGIAFQAFYTFTRSLTTSDAGGFTSGNGGINNSNGINNVPEWSNLFQYPNEVAPAFTSSPSEDELRRLVYYNSSNIPAHRFRYNGIVDLPFGRGKRYGSDVSSGLNQVVGGWQVAFIGDMRGGFWRGTSGVFQYGDPLLSKDQRIEMTIFGQQQVLWFKGDFDPTLATGATGDLTALVPEDRSQRAVHPAGPNFDNRLPQVLADGTTRFTSITELYNPSPRNFYRGPGGWNLDFSIFKHFYVTEDLKLRFTADFFNIFNHPVDIDPNPSTGLVNLGRQVNEPRTIQLSLRFDW
jgi:hypothetical protein